ncbi:MAG: glycosyltransferase [Pseudomarimonas sp.]
MPLFTIVVVHYQGVNSQEVFLRGIGSLQAQTLQDFEILCYHDGPLLDTSLDFPVPVIASEQRHNDWGHSLRDRGIREARGDYILHFNADNVLFPNALEEIAKEIARPARLFDRQRQPLDTNDIIIFPIQMWGLVKFREFTLQMKGKRDFYLTMTGLPPHQLNIDCMQLVMKRELWLAEGGWHDKREASDGIMYEEFAAKYGYRVVGPVLGAHY